jgi:hypothetical protein
MPRLGGVFSALQAKLEEARISDLNYELGKWAQESRAYVSSFRHDGLRPWRRSSSATSSSVPKSTSLPAFPSSNNNKSMAGSGLLAHDGNKYQYRSTLQSVEDQEEALIKETVRSQANDTSVVERFIRVIESRSSNHARGAATAGGCSREEIRKKLAFTSGDNQDTCRPKRTGDLEVCFINEIIEEEDEEAGRCEQLPRSQSEFSSIASAAPPVESLQTKVTFDLAQCQSIARRKMIVEKRNRKYQEANAFNQLIGKNIVEDRLTPEMLSQMNAATLQVHIHFIPI